MTAKERLAELPEEVQKKVKNTLRVYDRVYVSYENGRWSVGEGICIKCHYGNDFKSYGSFTSYEIYTKEERRRNFREEFGYDAPF